MKHVGMTSAISNEDYFPTYSFFVYEDSEDMICINCDEPIRDAKRSKRLKDRQRAYMEVEMGYEDEG